MANLYVHSELKRQVFYPSHRNKPREFWISPMSLTLELKGWAYLELSLEYELFWVLVTFQSAIYSNSYLTHKPILHKSKGT